MSAVVPRAGRERVSYAPLPNHADPEAAPPHLPYGGLSIMPHDGGYPRGGAMPPPVGRRQMQVYRPMAEELKKYIDALAGPTER